MPKMTSIAKQVWKAIEDDVIVRRAIEKDIVSLKSLAVHLIKEHKLDAGTDAVISAIRRYSEETPLQGKYDKARKVIASSKDIRITTHIVEIAVEKSKRTQQLLEKAFARVNYEKGEILLINQGEQSIKLLVNDKNKAAVLKCFPKESVLHVEEGIAEVNVHLSDEAVRTPGIIAVIATELMVHEVNMVEFMSCVPELLIFVKQADVVKASEVLFGLCRLRR